MASVMKRDSAATLSDEKDGSRIAYSRAGSPREEREGRDKKSARER